MKTFFIILAIIYLSLCIYLIIAYGFRKTWALVRYSIVHLILTPFQVLAPLASIGYWLDKFILTRWITWIVMDDSRFDKTTESGYAKDYWIYIQDRGKTKETYWIALQWHIKRNRVGNLVNLFKVPNSNKIIDGRLIGNNFIDKVEFVIDKLYKNNDNKTPVKQDEAWVTMAGLKYIPKRKEDDIWQVNQGDIFSIETSILGTGFIWYNVGNWFSFRYSQCEYIEFPFIRLVKKFPFIKVYKWKGYRTIKLGTNSNRYPIAFKHQKDKSWK